MSGRAWWCVAVWALVFWAGGCGELGEPDFGEAPVLEYRSPINAYAGQEVIFDASASYDPDGEIAWYSFDFGDGAQASRSPEPVASHTWSEAGRYTTRVTVIDDAGGKASEFREILIVERGTVAGLRCQESRPWCPAYLVCEQDTFRCVSDRDGDGVRDEDDVCPGVFDEAQRDEDEDGIGDACAEPGYDPESDYCRADGDCPLERVCLDGLCRKKI